MKKIEKNDFISLSSHYQILDDDTNYRKHMIYTNQIIKDGEKSPVSISKDYIINKCKSASYFNSIIKVGKQNKYWTKKQLEKHILEYNYNLNRLSTLDAKNVKDWLDTLESIPKVGDFKLAGIKNIFESIRDQSVFTVTFKKADTKKTKKSYNAEIEERISKFLEPVQKAKRSKKSMEDAARESVMDLIENPVLDYNEGEMRTTICYKLDFSSNDGYYKVYDLENQKVSAVNIKTIESIIYDGTKYILE